MIVGLVGALGLAPLLSALVVGLSPTDGLTLATSVVTLAATALAAAAYPAWTASHIEPTRVLRGD
jgi:ABC-type lipoprotein release transport system permease subunit